MLNNEGWGVYGECDETHFHHRLQVAELRLQRAEELLRAVLEDGGVIPDVSDKIYEYFNPKLQRKQN